MKKSILAVLATLLMFFFVQTNVFAQDSEKIYDFMNVEHPPAYPGGISKFYEFLGQVVKYPRKAMKNNIQGAVKVSFIVEKDGSITNIKALTDFGFGLEKEAISVMKRTKKWNPGLLDGKPIRVRYNIPIKFSLE